MADDEYFTKSDLKDRDWTEAAIKNFYGEPDKTEPNPMYSSAAPMKLYRKDRVKRVEDTIEFRMWQDDLLAKREKRKRAAQKAKKTKIAKLLDQVQDWTPRLQDLTKHEIRERAIEHYNERNRDRSQRASASSSPDFLDRIMVNYLRHTCTDYERRLRALEGEIGKEKAYAAVKKRVLTRIAKRYSFLRDECGRQIEEIDEYGD